MLYGLLTGVRGEEANTAQEIFLGLEREVSEEHEEEKKAFFFIIVVLFVSSGNKGEVFKNWG